MSRFRQRLESVLTWPPPLALGLAFIFLFFATGFHATPALNAVVKISQHLWSNPFAIDEDGQWLMGSYLDPMLGAWFNANTSNAHYYAFHLALTILAVVGLYFAVRQRSATAANEWLVLFLSAPISYTLFWWIGYSDIYVFIGSSILVVFAGHGAITFLTATALAIAHFEQAAIVLLLWVVLNLQQLPYSKLVTPLVGLCLGKGLLMLAFSGNGILQTETRLEYIADFHLADYVALALAQPALPYTFVHGSVLFWYLGYRDLSNNFRARYAICWLIATVVALFTIDTTRVASLLTWPVLLHFYRETRNVERFDRYGRQSVFAWLLVAALFAPKIQVWNGKIYGAEWRDSLRRVDEYIDMSFLLNRPVNLLDSAALHFGHCAEKRIVQARQTISAERCKIGGALIFGPYWDIDPQEMLAVEAIVEVERGAIEFTVDIAVDNRALVLAQRRLEAGQTDTIRAIIENFPGGKNVETRLWLQDYEPNSTFRIVNFRMASRPFEP